MALTMKSSARMATISSRSRMAVPASCRVIGAAARSAFAPVFDAKMSTTKGGFAPSAALGRRSAVKVSANAAAAPAPTPAAPAFKWGANMKDLSISVGIAALLWFVPPPVGVSVKAWHLLSVFVGTIVGIITTPLPLGAVAMLGMGAAMLTKVLTFAEAFSAFSSEIP